MLLWPVCHITEIFPRDQQGAVQGTNLNLCFYFRQVVSLQFLLKGGLKRPMQQLILACFFSPQLNLLLVSNNAALLTQQGQRSRLILSRTGEGCLSAQAGTQPNVHLFIVRCLHTSLFLGHKRQTITRRKHQVSGFFKIVPCVIFTLSVLHFAGYFLRGLLSAEKQRP